MGQSKPWGTRPCGFLPVTVGIWALPKPLEGSEQRGDDVWLTFEEVTPAAEREAEWTAVATRE